MKTIKLISLLIIFFSPHILHSQTLVVSGSIGTNTNWNADTVKINGDLTVEPGITLTINPGTYIEVQRYYRINISGSIRAVGTPADTIVFTVRDTAHFWKDTLGVTGGWAGINIIGNVFSTDSSIFEYCKIQYAKRYDWYGGDIKGGAIYASDFGTLLIKNCLISSNMVICYVAGVDGPAGGAIFCKNVNKVTIAHNRFERNRSFENGGAIHIDVNCQTLITNNIFTNNKALYWQAIGPMVGIGGAGGAVYTSDGSGFSPVICNNYCYNNAAINGAIYTSNRNGLIFNNVVCNNMGTGITDGHQLSTSRIFNNTIVNNRTESGGIELFSKAIVYNNICWNNILQHGQYPDQISVFELLAHPRLFNNCVQYGNGGTGGISISPEFVDPTQGVGLAVNGWDGDWDLTDLSPCINQGTSDTAGLVIPELDITGNPRIYGNRIEMGAYENQTVMTERKESEIFIPNTLVFPNPGTVQLNIISPGQAVTVELVNVSGQVILQKNIGSGTASINTASLNAGTYSYRMLNINNKVIASGKWIKMVR